VLAGDAADFYDPFTGEGIYAALLGGEIAAPHVIESLRCLERGDVQSSDAALRAYNRARHSAFSGKWRVEKLIGAAVAMPWLMNHAARVLGRDRALADLLVGVTGDFVPPSQVLRPRTLLRFVWPRRAEAPVPTQVLHAHRQ
jgi:flavin-dependent dehydrogenase